MVPPFYNYNIASLFIRKIELYSCQHPKLILSFCALPDPVLKVTLAVSNLQRSVNYWSKFLGMKVYDKDEDKQKVLLGYADNQVGLSECKVFQSCSVQPLAWVIKGCGIST